MMTTTTTTTTITTTTTTTTSTTTTSTTTTTSFFLTFNLISSLSRISDSNGTLCCSHSTASSFNLSTSVLQRLFNFSGYGIEQRDDDDNNDDYYDDDYGAC